MRYTCTRVLPGDGIPVLSTFRSPGFSPPVCPDFLFAFLFSLRGPRSTRTREKRTRACLIGRMLWGSFDTAAWKRTPREKERGYDIARKREIEAQGEEGATGKCLGWKGDKEKDEKKKRERERAREKERRSISAASRVRGLSRKGCVASERGRL